jgi:hypothetical protein
MVARNVRQPVDASHPHRGTIAGMAFFITKCFVCKKNTPHKSLGIYKDANGVEQQRMECAECKAASVVAVENFQENIDTPDSTDLSGLNAPEK